MSEIQQLINRYREVIKSQQINELANNYVSQASHISQLRTEQINEIKNKYLDLLVRTEDELMRLGIVKSRRQLSTLLLQDATQLNNIIRRIKSVLPPNLPLSFKNLKTRARWRRPTLLCRW